MVALVKDCLLRWYLETPNLEFGLIEISFKCSMVPIMGYHPGYKADRDLRLECTILVISV